MEIRKSFAFFVVNLTRFAIRRSIALKCADRERMMIVLNSETLATKQDLAELRAEIIKWNTGTLLAVTGLFALIVKLMS